MRRIKQLCVTKFRNISTINLNNLAQFQCFCGENGAGKTSLLEAIYFLGHAKSFRDPLTRQIIQKEQDNCCIFADIEQKGQNYSAAIQKFSSGKKQIKLQQENLSSIADITKLLPIQLLSNFSYRFFYDGTKTRQSYLDWVMFHVKQPFYSLWQQLQRVVRQRNSLLKNKASYNTLNTWDIQLVDLSEKIDMLRLAVFNQLKSLFHQQIHQLLPGYELELSYNRGWPEEIALIDQLNQQYYQDLVIGYTRYGAHRADLKIVNPDKQPIQQRLSQGQQKLALYALHLAQGLLLQQESASNPIYLIDDLPSELDANKRERVMQTLLDMDAQVFLTAISNRDLPIPSHKTPVQLFHVKQGEILQ